MRPRLVIGEQHFLRAEDRADQIGKGERRRQRPDLPLRRIPGRARTAVLVREVAVADAVMSRHPCGQERETSLPPI